MEQNTFYATVGIGRVLLLAVFVFSPIIYSLSIAVFLNNLLTRKFYFIFKSILFIYLVWFVTFIFMAFVESLVWMLEGKIDQASFIALLDENSLIRSLISWSLLAVCLVWSLAIPFRVYKNHRELS